MSEDIKNNETLNTEANTEEVLASPLIVHKKGDASYQETANAVDMAETHTDDDSPTLERHRFKKESKKGGTAIKVILVIIVIACAVFAGLYFGGVINFNKNTATTTQKATTAADSTTSLQDSYDNTIVIKGTYIFVDGKEVDGIKGLQDAIKYTDPSPTAYTIILEGSSEAMDNEFYNDEVLPILTDLGFFSDNTTVEHISSTGLVAAAEENTTTATQPTTTTTTTTTKAE